MAAITKESARPVVAAFLELVERVLGREAREKLKAAARKTTSPVTPSAALPTNPIAESFSELPGPPAGSGAVPPEILAAMLQAKIEGDDDAVDALAELGSDPEGLSDFLADRDAGTQGMPGPKFFSQFVKRFSAMSPAASASTPVVAGLALRAADTGRLLALKRAENASDQHAGRIEFPGGHLKPGEDHKAGAKREWEEETGMAFPASANPVGSWPSRDGRYIGHVYDVPTEAEIVQDRPGDQAEELAWIDAADLDRPEVRDELRRDADRVRSAFTAVTPVKFFGWFADPTPRSKSRATNSDTGAHAYGARAQSLLAWQAREDKGEAHPKTPKQQLIENKQQAEPRREEARAAYRAALENPLGVKAEQLPALAEHLKTLTRDEIRQNLQEVERAAKGKLKHELVDALLAHVRETAIGSQEAAIDPLDMGYDADTALRNIQGLHDAGKPKEPEFGKPREWGTPVMKKKELEAKESRETGAPEPAESAKPAKPIPAEEEEARAKSAEIAAESRRPVIDDHDREQLAAKEAHREKMEQWAGDKPDSQAAVDAADRARGAVEVEKERVNAAPPSVASQTAVPPSQSLPDFAAAVRAAAEAEPRGPSSSGGSVYLHHVYDALHAKDPTLTREQFNQRMIEAQSQGLLKMGRADLPQALHPEDVAASELQHGNAAFHFLHGAGEKRRQVRGPNYAKPAEEWHIPKTYDEEQAEKYQGNK